MCALQTCFYLEVQFEMTPLCGQKDDLRSLHHSLQQVETYHAHLPRKFYEWPGHFTGLGPVLSASAIASATRNGLLMSSPHMRDFLPSCHKPQILKACTQSPLFESRLPYV